MPPVLLNPYRFGGGTPPATGYAAEVLADAPVAFYKLDEASGSSAADSSGNSRTGTIQGTPSAYRAGGPAGIGPALSFDADSYVSIASASWMDVGTAGAIESWFYTSSTADLSIAGRSSASGYFFLDYVSSTTLRFYLTTSGGTTICSATVSGLRNDAWHHIVGTYDGTNMRLYCDGVLKATTAKTGSVLTTVGNLYVARRYNDPSTLAPNRSCAAALYGTALSGTRVTAHYNAGITP